MAIAVALVLAVGSGATHAAGLTTMAVVMAWVTVVLCLARGVPVIVEGLRRHWVRPSVSAPLSAVLIEEHR